MTHPDRQALDDLTDALRTAGRSVFALHTASPPSAFGQAADDLADVLALARALARPRSLTGCDQHPQGATDPNPDPDWGTCLICNTNRRRARKGLTT